MDYYPQPRPVLYGNPAEEAPPRTQTSPVRAEPPRWPPAPPSAGFADNSGDHQPWRGPVPAQSRSNDAPGRYVIAVLYALAFTYALCVALFMPQVLADIAPVARLFLLLQIAAAPWVVPCFAVLERWEYLVALGVSLLLVVLGLFAPLWLSPGMIAGLCGCIYLLRPRMLASSRACAVRRLLGEAPPYTQSSYEEVRIGNVVRSGKWRRRRGPINASRPPVPDDWKSRFN
jgi:hypothetical protein